jgi:hypothetical protein
MDTGKQLVEARDLYRRHAEACKRKAKEAKDLDARRSFEFAAEQWRLMAAQAERMGWWSTRAT